MAGLALVAERAFLTPSFAFARAVASSTAILALDQRDVGKPCGGAGNGLEGPLRGGLGRPVLAQQLRLRQQRQGAGHCGHKGKMRKGVFRAEPAESALSNRGEPLVAALQELRFPACLRCWAFLA